MKELFHVHTYRCKHAGDEREIEYVEKAIDLDADRLTFTDHAPFPGNPFRSRMQMEELDDYINTLVELRDKYVNQIDIKIGLETEFLPEFWDLAREKGAKTIRGLDAHSVAELRIISEKN